MAEAEGAIFISTGQSGGQKQSSKKLSISPNKTFVPLNQIKSVHFIQNPTPVGTKLSEVPLMLVAKIANYNDVYQA
jgi:hypothetical protein